MKVSDRPTQIAIWLYFWLLLLEGVFRKWVTPQWSDAIFLIRDPVVVMIYLLAIRAKVFPMRPAMAAVLLLAVASLGFSVAGNAPFVVTLFGLRTDFLHLPLVFVMASVFDREDVLRFGKWFIITSVPIIVLMIVQFNSPPSSWINAGAGGSVNGQLRGAMGHIRPPGPFSFIEGVVSYFAFVLAFVVSGWLNREARPWLLTLVGSLTVVAAVPVSVSRSLLFSFLVIGLFAFAVVLRDLRRIPSYIGPVVAAISLLVLQANSTYVRVFVARWQEAEEAGGAGFYGNVVMRMLGDLTVPFRVAIHTPIMGYGIGLGTVAGARLATGQYAFLLAESELARMVAELGPILGFAFIAWRVWLSGYLVLASWRRFLRTHDSLAWLLAGASFLPVLWGQWGPATSLGFAVFGAGLTLAALNEAQAAEDEEIEEDVE